jgi:hypothetical protein
MSRNKKVQGLGQIEQKLTTCSRHPPEITWSHNANHGTCYDYANTLVMENPVMVNPNNHSGSRGGEGRG